MSEQSLIDAAKASTIAYNNKDWNAAKAALTPDFLYDEVATNRKIQGADEVITAWQGWGAAFPDSKATFDKAHASGDTVVLEVTWRGTHKGPLQTATRQIPATGKAIEIRACQVFEIAGGKAKSMRHYWDMATMLQQIGASA
jgi:steroid delta-isomerase-like uncharacterized protein